MGIALDTLELAWAAGFFDAEGYAGAYLHHRGHVHTARIALSQGGAGLPPILERFRRAVGGHGHLIGPVRGYLYYWTAGSFETVQAVIAMLWPWLSRPKRTQVRRAILLARGLTVPTSPPRAPVPRDWMHELAWAAGLFDGDGSVSASVSVRPSRYRCISASISQASAEGVAEALVRFSQAVARGRIRGPKVMKNPWSRLPQYRWEVTRVRDVEAVAELLWRWLDVQKRDQVHASLARYRAWPSIRE